LSDYLFLANVGDGIVNSVQLSRFVPNRRVNSRAKVDYKVGVYTQSFDSVFWEKLDEIEFSNSNNISLSSSNYSLDVGQLAVIIPCEVDFDLLDRYSELPIPVDRKVDLSPVNERAAIHFTKGDSFSSYQGEFPYQMSRIKGTFLAFDPLIQRTDGNIKTKIAFINIHSDNISKKTQFNLNVANAHSKERIISNAYVHNSAGIIDINNTDNIELCFYSKDTLGIPIFISYNESGYLSVEHTHPPSEYFWNNKFKGQQLLKQNWLSQLQ
jgi:hypothetical protein